MDALTKLQSIRLIAVRHRPYFGLALHALRLVNTDKVETMAIDQHGRVYVNTNRIGGKGGWTLEEGAGVLVHELNHWLRKHHLRAASLLKNVDPKDLAAERDIVNICEDMEINDDLLEAVSRADGPALKLPKDGQWPQKYGLPPHLLWEEYYAKFPREKVPVCGLGLDCGSAAHGQRGAYEEPIDGSGQLLSESEQELIRKQTAHSIMEAAKRDPGSVPRGSRLWAAEFLRPPTVPWERELQALTRNAFTMARGQQDYSYAKRSRRQFLWKVIQPAMVRPEIEAAIVVDTSGSMDQELRDAALSETNGVLRAAGQRRVPVICCDAQVHGGVQRVASALDVQVLGGGGTDMGAGIEEAAKLKVKVVIVFTDGFTPWPSSPPRGIELVIGIIGRSKQDMEDALGGWHPPVYAKRIVHILTREQAKR